MWGCTWPRVRCYRYCGCGSSCCTSWMMTVPADTSYRAGVDGATMTARGASALRWLVRGVRGDVVLAVVAGLIQVGGTALAARHQTDVRMLDALGYLLLALGPAALIVRRRWPVAVLWVAFATTFCYLLLGYPGGPIWIALIVAFGTALVLGHRIAAYVSLLVGYPCFGWLVSLVNGQPLPPAWVAGGIAAWLLLLVAVSELVRNRRAFAQASRQRAIEERRSQREAARRQASEERLGIARELHDVLGHSLSLINVQAGVALELMDRKPEQARTALTAIRQTSTARLIIRHYCQRCLSRRMAAAIRIVPSTALRVAGLRCWSGDGRRWWCAAGGWPVWPAATAAGSVSCSPAPSRRRLCMVNSRAKDGPTSSAAAVNTTMSATRVACGAPALARVSGVPGSSTGYWATPQPQTTAATPSAAVTRVRVGQPGPRRPAASRATTARPQAPAVITSGSARPVSRA